MKTPSVYPLTHPRTATLNPFTRLAALLTLIGLVGFSLFPSSSASSIPAEVDRSTNPAQISLKPSALFPLSFSNFEVFAETIETFASDCVTPRTSFVLGETVCAKTDGVDLAFPGGRWVHWLRPDNSIAFGGSGVTDITTNPQTFTFVPDTLGAWKATIAETGDISQTPAVFTVVAAPPLGTYQADCVTPKSSFSLGDTVCAKLVGTPALRSRLAILNTGGFTLASTDVTMDPQTVSFTLPTAATEFFGGQQVDNRGTWSVNQVDSSDVTVRSAIKFTVTDPTTDVADISTASALVSGTEISPNSDVVFKLHVFNKGPNAAASVEILDTVPTNTTFVSLVQDSGPTFVCVNPGVGNTGTSTCTLAILPVGALAEFTLTYKVDGGVPAGTAISHTVITTSATEDSNTLDNTSNAGTEIPTGTTAEACLLSCRADLVVTADTTQGGTEGKFVTFASVNANAGNCGSLTTSPASGSFFPVGSTPVQVTSELGEGSCSFNVIVTTIAPPMISCPQDVTVNVGAGETSANVNPGSPTTSPATGVTVTFDRSDDDDDPDTQQKPLSDPYPLGLTNIFWTVKDASGRTATCQQRIIVQVENRPLLTISCPATVNATAEDCNTGATNVNLGTPTTTPSDSNVEVSAARSDGSALTDPYPVGNTQVVWTATDNVNGNVATCTQVVHVTTAGDNSPPTLNVPGPINTTTSSCSVLLDDELGVATAEDSCSAVSLSRTGVPPNFIFPTGTTIITYTATDASGNIATATQTVTVLESPAIPPTITAPAAVTAFTGPGATSCDTVVSNATLGTATGSDNCGPPVTITRSPAGNTFAVGTTVVTWTATDRSGNTATATQNVTVIDNTPPVVTAPADVTLFTGPGATSCSVTVADLDPTFGTGTATDNCPGVGAVSRTGVPAGNVFPVGTTTLTYSATDAHGNTSQDTQVVTVVDNTKPVFTTPLQPDIVLEPTCPFGAIATFPIPAVTDNCGVQSVVRTAGPASGSVFPIGTTTVTFTATDIHGNTETDSFTVTVLTPQAVIQNMMNFINGIPSLTGQQRQGLLSKLQAALDAINEGKTNVACNKLNDFNSQVSSFISNGTLTAAQGNSLLSSSNNVRNTIGCTGLPCS